MVEIQNIWRTVFGSLGAAAIVLALAALTAFAAKSEDLISGIGLTHLTVYDQRPAPDGEQSGSPHVHAVTDEGYYCMSGTGRVELHDLKNGFRSVELTPGRYLQFPPGTLHRLVNTGGLTILVVMGNAGLAERGDARIYFGKKVDGDPAEYARLAGLPQSKGLEGALDRRDAAIRAYMNLIELWEKDKKAYFADLGRFLNVHNQAMAKKKDGLQEAVEAGPLAWAGIAAGRLESLPKGEKDPVSLLFKPGDEIALGMCGILRPIDKLEAVGARR